MGARKGVHVNNCTLYGSETICFIKFQLSVTFKSIVCHVPNSVETPAVGKYLKNLTALRKFECFYSNSFELNLEFFVTLFSFEFHANGLKTHHDFLMGAKKGVHVNNCALYSSETFCFNCQQH